MVPEIPNEWETNLYAQTQQDYVREWNIASKIMLQMNSLFLDLVIFHNYFFLLFQRLSIFGGIFIIYRFDNAKNSGGWKNNSKKFKKNRSTGNLCATLCVCVYVVIQGSLQYLKKKLLILVAVENGSSQTKLLTLPL